MPLSQSALITKLNTYAPLTSEEIASLTGVQSKPIVVRRGKELFHEGQHGQMVFIVQRGWASSYKDVPDGGRQIINFAIPGDCVGLRSVLLKESDHAFSALTDSTLRTIDAVRMTQLFEDLGRGVALAVESEYAGQLCRCREGVDGRAKEHSAQVLHAASTRD